MIDELERLRDAHGEHGDEIQGEINYLEANRERMNYPQYREQHLPIRQRHGGKRLQERRCRADEG